MFIVSVSMDADCRVQLERKELTATNNTPFWWDELSDFSNPEYDNAYEA